MAHDVFISSSHKDKPVADADVAGFENKELRCWLAPRYITAGEDWPTADGAVNNPRPLRSLRIGCWPGENQQEKVSFKPSPGEEGPLKTSPPGL